MKFGEALTEGLVSEWQDQYVNYKEGKKLIKKVKRLKDEYELNDSTTNDSSRDSINNNNGTNNDDRTPLLGPIDPDINYTRDRDRDRDQDQTTTTTNKNNDIVPPPSSKSSVRRPSIFNYSTKSDKTDYFTERRKFQLWLDEQLNKVDEFYSDKEEDVYERFLILQDQLYQLKDQKAQLKRQQLQHDGKNNDTTKPSDHQMVDKVSDLAFHTKHFLSGLNRWELPSLPSMRFLKNFKKHPKYEDDISLHIQDSTDLNYAENRVRNGIVDLSDKSHSDDQTSYDSESEFEDSLQQHNYPSRQQQPPRPSQEIPQTEAQIRINKRRDYTKKKQHFGVPYLYAKKQLKTALLEHYRSLSILKSYKNMNRTAFRKITKKYDKAMNTHIMESFMERIDTTSYFLTSDLLNKIINQVEELYIVFFDPESKDRKQSLEKLKTIAYTINANEMKSNTFYSEFFSSGLFLGFGLPLFILALYVALDKTLGGEMTEGKFLLQVWGGFFLLTLMFLLFGINLAIFEKYRINYKFIFEFNMATALNYKQYWVIPCFAFGLLSLLAWFSFNNFWPHKFPGRDWPWIFFGVLLVIFLWPGNIFYGSSRRWLQFAILRLILSGLYPVEFRDFFLGDIVCSLTYTMGNLPFFFCLFANHWVGTLPGQDESRNKCTSSRSHLMGFFSALPSVWRLLQCIRRYMDTGDWFPHLANMLKYSVSTVYYMTLSLYRIDGVVRNKVAFIVFAFINSIYCSIWDIVMDWSLLQSGSKHFLLRDYLFYKKPIYYYFAMIIDIILRFQWVFYAFFNHQIQQSAVTSFCVATAEIIRRFIWIFFRMENEHVTNVILFRASKETPLPYSVSVKTEKAIKKLVELRYDNNQKPQESDFDPSSNEETVGFTTGRENSRQEERRRSSIDLTRISTTSQSTPQLQQRKTYFKQITDKLNSAHIKDFQRRKTIAPHEEDSDDEEEEFDDSSINVRSKNSRNSMPSVREE
ncbi:SYG1 [Candida pseudojiufengensis]|uniref:SYG1 n=1 Tax=Candida pseudojiufengensis TaxID=497109 RepID=UPI0022249C80|nr:SYG1 [Candida pseudojiufengensis]KAI5966543.1 SYG1 [Candida pseudojiufengensis]